MKKEILRVMCEIKEKKVLRIRKKKEEEKKEKKLMRIEKMLIEEGVEGKEKGGGDGEDESE
jgi:hypothetical protein